MKQIVCHKYKFRIYLIGKPVLISEKIDSNLSFSTTLHHQLRDEKPTIMRALAAVRTFNLVYIS